MKEAIIIKEEQLEPAIEIAEIIDLNAAKRKFEIIEILDQKYKLPQIIALDKALFLEEVLLKMTQIEIVPTHRFADGMYARECFVPKDTLLTGEIHNGTYFTTISKGDITVIAIEGNTSITKRVKAPFTFIATPGIKRIAYAHEDTVWTTYHSTTKKDIKEVEEEIFDRSYKLTEEKRALLQKMPIMLDGLQSIIEGNQVCLE